MDNIRITPELIEQLKSVKSKEELMKAVGEQGYSLTEVEAAAIFMKYFTTGELSDDELDHVTGGGCFDPKCYCGGVYHFSRAYCYPGEPTLYVYICDRCLCEYHTYKELKW